MNPAQFAIELKKKQAALKQYAYNEYPKRAGNMALRFINGNFRAQGWQGTTFQRWKPTRRKGTILIRKGRLRRGTKYAVGSGAVRVYNDVPYAAAHNNGFYGTVQIKAHTRRNFESQRQPTGRLTKAGKTQMRTIHVVKGVSKVKAHTRSMKIPKRQFMPKTWNDSPVLVKAYRREIERTLKKIFN